MRKTPWPLVFVATSLLVSAGLVMWPRGLPAEHQPGLAARTDISRTTLNVLEDSGWANSDLNRDSLPSGLQILLQVVDQDGHPLSGVQIQCERITSHSIGRVAEGQSDGNGEFASPRLVPGHYEVQIQDSQCLPTATLKLQLPVQGGTQHVVRLQQGCVVQGELEGSDGVPRNHGWVELKQADGEMVHLIQPDADGTFRFPAVADGDWVLSWQQSKSAPLDSRLQRGVNCRAGEVRRFVVTTETLDYRAMAPTDERHEGGIHDLSLD